MNHPFSTEVPELLNKHLDHLKASAISIDVIRERGYRSVLGKTDLKNAGFSKAQHTSRSTTKNQLVGSPLFVKLIPELSGAALKWKLDKELALWYELRSINHWGSGRLVLKDTLAALGSSFGYSQPTAYRILKAGDGKFWHIWDKKGPCPIVYIHGLLRVAEYVNTYCMSRPTEVPASDFKRRRSKRAWLYASFFKPDGSGANPISRHSIEAATGVLRRQQQRYDKVVRIRRTANFAFWQQDNRLVRMLAQVSGKTRKWTVLRRLGNIYHTGANNAHKGMIRKVNRVLKQRSYDRGARLLPRFFRSAKSAVRSPQRAQEAFLLASNRDRLIKGRLEWVLI